MIVPPHRRDHPGRRSLVIVLLILVTLTGCSSGEAGRQRESQFTFSGATAAGEVIPVDERAPAPAFTGELLNGATFRSATLTGGPALINFWGSWCPPCRLETPDLEAVYAALRDRGVQFLGVDVKDERQLASAFVTSNDVQYPSLFDPRGEAALAFRGFPANVVPSTVLLDAQSRVAAVYTGAINQVEARKALTTLLQETGS